MTYPAFDTSHIPDAEEPRGGPITCAACGCRLERSPDGQEDWYHYSPGAGRDARGCLVRCVNVPHNAHGRAALAA
jgi:hypothetical protein